jgi:hypothetical protein
MPSARVELKQRLFAVGVLALLLCACSRKSSEQRPQIDIAVNGDSCDCSVSAYRLFVVGEQAATGRPCLFFAGEADPGPVTLRRLPFVEGERYTLVAFAYCGTADCEACEGEVSLRAGQNERAVLTLDPVDACRPARADPSRLPACSEAGSDAGPSDARLGDAAPDDARLGDTAPGDAGVTDGPQDVLVVDGFDRDTIPADGAPHDTAPPDASVPDAENLIIDLFERSDSFVVPDGVQLIRIQAWGAGGGGGEPNDEGKAGSTGGGGGYAESTLVVEPGQILAINVGRGGEGGGCSQRGGEGSYAGGDGGGGILRANGEAGEGPRGVSGGEGGLGYGSGEGGRGGYGGGGGGGYHGAGGGAATSVWYFDGKVDYPVVVAGGGGGGGEGTRGDGGPGCSRDGRDSTLYSDDGGGGGGGACLGELTENGSGPVPGRSVEAGDIGRGGQQLSDETACSDARGADGGVIISYRGT